MTAATANVERPRRDGAVVRYGLKAGVRIHQGTIVQWDATAAAGPAAPAVAGNNNVYLGVAITAADNRTGAAGAVSVEVQRQGAFYFPFETGHKPEIGGKALVVDNQTVSENEPNARAPCGIVIDSDDDGVWVLWGASDLRAD